MEIIDVKTRSKTELIDITPQVKQSVASAEIDSGICIIYVPHTTAGVTINENADPSVREDILTALKSIVPDSLPYSHGEGNSPAHVKSSLVGSSVHVIIESGRLALGTWQGIFFCEFDGPRSRKVWVSVLPQ
jgi:secondary thiamine-phosphate synthase enzyme